MGLNDHDAQRLPSPPNAGYQTARQKSASDWMNETCRQYERDYLLLLTILAEGRRHWITRNLRAMSGTLKSAHLEQALNDMFDHFLIYAGPNWRLDVERFKLMAQDTLPLGQTRNHLKVERYSVENG